MKNVKTAIIVALAACASLSACGRKAPELQTDKIHYTMDTRGKQFAYIDDPAGNITSCGFEVRGSNPDFLSAVDYDGSVGSGNLAAAFRWGDKIDDTYNASADGITASKRTFVLQLYPSAKPSSADYAIRKLTRVDTVEPTSDVSVFNEHGGAIVKTVGRGDGKRTYAAMSTLIYSPKKTNTSSQDSLSQQEYTVFRGETRVVDSSHNAEPIITSGYTLELPKAVVDMNAEAEHILARAQDVCRSYRKAHPYYVMVAKAP